MAGLAQAWRTKLTIQTINTDARVIELSGGNQPKSVIAKALAQRPQRVIFDEPARGMEFAPDQAAEEKILCAAMH